MAYEIESREAVEVMEEARAGQATDYSPEPVAREPESVIPEPDVGLSEALLGRAQGYGLSADDLTGLDDSRVERLFGAMDRRIMQPQQPTDYRLQATGQPEPVARSPEPETYLPLTMEYGEDLDESVRTPFQTVVEHMNGQMKQIHAFRHEMHQELQAMNVLREFANFDHFVGGLGEDWKTSYGSGATMEMDPQGAEFQKRLEVFHGARSLMADAQRRGQRMNLSDALTRSHHAVHWDRIAEKQTEKLDGKIQRRRRGFSEPPVKGKAPAMSPREEAVLAWTK